MSSRFKIYLFILFFIGVLLNSPSVLAQSSPSESDEARRSQEPIKIIENVRDRWSQRLFKLSNEIDMFISNENTYSEENDSQMILGLKVITEDKALPVHDFLINTYLRLPLTENKFQVFLTSFEDPDKTDTQENALGAGLRFEFLKAAHFTLQTDGGIKITDRIDPFVRLRLKNLIPLKIWEVRLVQTLSWFTSVNYEFLSEIFLDRQINKFLLFRVYTGANWSEENALIDIDHNYNLIHTFNKRQALVYQLGLEGSDEPEVHVETYLLNISVRTLVYEDWLYLSLAPGVVWRKEDQFATRPQIMFRLDMILGAI